MLDLVKKPYNQFFLLILNGLYDLYINKLYIKNIYIKHVHIKHILNTYINKLYIKDNQLSPVDLKESESQKYAFRILIWKLYHQQIELNYQLSKLFL